MCWAVASPARTGSLLLILVKAHDGHGHCLGRSGIGGAVVKRGFGRGNIPGLDEQSYLARFGMKGRVGLNELFEGIQMFEGVLAVPMQPLPEVATGIGRSHGHIHLLMIGNGPTEPGFPFSVFKDDLVEVHLEPLGVWEEKVMQAELP